ncbi:MAG TPA: 3-oxoacyl-ACP synthase III family protein [Phycisphaerae bacterium]|nr:3-oxoacyl-ACP synthase III family protein [Phycisphaerae bacterium]HRY67191.1 3-oxoacyl-ACP synthase III family protein [Phycisphaerae bacterium]HSA26439.1 3-oxoacyl-ACP synthase III family protein [Phycisphaerae bacterium]
MNPQLKRVSIVGTGSFLPNDPVPNSRLDEVLGPLTDAPERVKSFMETIGTRMLANSGVEFRHFAIDIKTRKLTHTVASLGEEAVRRALDAAGIKATDVDLLILASSNYDETTPPTSALLQERLGIETCAEMEVHSNCSGVGKAIQIAYDALRVGRYKTAVAVYPQLSSVYLRREYLNQPFMTKKQAALRYILADGAGAVVLQAVDTPAGKAVPHELLGTFVESVGGKRPPGMTAGGGVGNLVEPDKQIVHMWKQGLHHLDQDFAAVNRDAARTLHEGVVRMIAQLGIDPKSVSQCVFSIPTRQLYEDGVGPFMEFFGLTRNEIKFRACNTGYCGGASLLLHFDEIARNGELKAGDVVVVHSVESSKWMTAGFVVRW